MLRGLELFCCEERMRKLGWFSLEKRPTGGYKKAGEELFVRECVDRTRGNGFH